MKDNSEKSKRKSNKFKVGMFVVVFFLILYIPSLINWVYGKNISTDLVRNGVLEDSIDTYGIIIRNEEVLKSQFEGKYIPQVSEGERVPANYRVATILKKSSIDLLEKLKDLDAKILENSKSESSSLFSYDIVKIDNQIDQKVRNIIEESNNNNLLCLNDTINNINELMQKKATIVSGMDTKDAYVNSLKKERKQLQEQINTSTMDIKTKYSGIVSYNVDSLEEILNPKAIDKLTPAFINSVDVKGAANKLNVKDVEMNKPFARIIKDNEYYVAVVLDSQEAEYFKEGDLINVRINDIGKIIYDQTIMYKSPESERKQVVIVKLDRYVSETAGMRKISIDLIKSLNEGLKVPMKSLKGINTQEMNAKIVLVRANCAIVREVKILGMNSEFAIICDLNENDRSIVSLYDTYIINPENIEEGQIIIQ